MGLDRIVQSLMLFSSFLFYNIEHIQIRLAMYIANILFFNVFLITEVKVENLKRESNS